MGMIMKLVAGACIALSAASFSSVLATPIDDRYANLGGANSFLGAPTMNEATVPDGIGRYRHYENGSIYWHPNTGPHEIHGLIRQRWAELGWEKSYLGYPMTDEINTVDGAGRVTKFQGGEIIWHRADNSIREVKSSDLVVDWPFPVGEPWILIQPNGTLEEWQLPDESHLPEEDRTKPDSHIGQWAYCWDMVHAQTGSNGRPFTAAHSGKIVYVDEYADSGGDANVVVQKVGEGKYASYLHIMKSSYTKRFFGAFTGLRFLPQALPWAERPTPKIGVDLGEVSNTGTEGAHMHFCVTTKPDRGQFGPFESVPVSFRNYSFSTDQGKTWTYVAQGVPRKGQWVRRETPVNEKRSFRKIVASPLSYGEVNGTIALGAKGKPSGPGTLQITLMSEWGEPLRSTTINVATNNLNGPWLYSIKKAPAFDDMIVSVRFAGPWSRQTGGPVSGQSGTFVVTPDGTATQDLVLKATALR